MGNQLVYEGDESQSVRPIGISKFGALTKVIKRPKSPTTIVKPSLPRKTSCTPTDCNSLECEICEPCQKCPPRSKSPTCPENCSLCPPKNEAKPQNPQTRKPQFAKRSMRIFSSGTCNSNECGQAEGCFVKEVTLGRKCSGEVKEIPRFLKVKHNVRTEQDLTDDVKKTIFRSMSTNYEETMESLQLPAEPVIEKTNSVNEAKGSQNGSNQATKNDAEGTSSTDSSEEAKAEGDAMKEGSYTEKNVDGWKLDLIKNHPKARTGDRIRNDLLRKLTYQKIWLTPCEKPSTHQTVIIFDWDDTLLCTSFLNPKGYVDDSKLLCSVVLSNLEKLQDHVQKLLKLATSLGKTYIITNAQEGWVEYSSQLYMPKVYEVLDDIKIISARERYEKYFPTEFNQWKMQAFMLTEEDLEESAVTNLVVLGDSKIEMDAAAHLAKRFSRACIKTIKFKETPTPEELIKQLKLVSAKLEEIVMSPKNWTIRLERKNEDKN